MFINIYTSGPAQFENNFHMDVIIKGTLQWGSTVSEGTLSWINFNIFKTKQKIKIYTYLNTF